MSISCGKNFVSLSLKKIDGRQWELLLTVAKKNLIFHHLVSEKNYEYCQCISEKPQSGVEKKIVDFANGSFEKKKKIINFANHLWQKIANSFNQSWPEYHEFR